MVFSGTWASPARPFCRAFDRCVRVAQGLFHFRRGVHGDRRALSAVCPHGPGGRGGGSGGGNDQSTKSRPAGCEKPAGADFRDYLFTTAIGGLIFQSTTFSLPKIFDERLTDFAGTATLVGWYAFVVFSVAALTQLVVGYLLDAFSLRIVLAVVAITQASFFIIMTHLSGIASLLAAIGFMLAVFGQIPSTMFCSGARGFSALFRLLAAAALLIFLAVMLLPKGD